MGYINQQLSRMISPMIMLHPAIVLVIVSLLHGTTAEDFDGYVETGPYSVMTSIRCYNATALAYRYQSLNRTKIIACPKDNPYCDRKLRACVPKKPVPAFACPAFDGFFPLIDSCYGFMVCMNNKPYKFECMKGQYYNHVKQECTSWWWSSCIKFKCKGKSALMVGYEKDKRLYTLCEKGNPVSLNLCPVGWQFHENVQRCEIVCAGEGVFQDYKDKKMYYRCISVTAGFKLIIFYCPDQQIYDSKKDACVMEKIVEKDGKKKAEQEGGKGPEGGKGQQSGKNGVKNQGNKN